MRSKIDHAKYSSSRRRVTHFSWQSIIATALALLSATIHSLRDEPSVYTLNPLLYRKIIVFQPQASRRQSSTYATPWKRKEGKRDRAEQIMRKTTIPDNYKTNRTGNYNYWSTLKTLVADALVVWKRWNSKLSWQLAIYVPLTGPCTAQAQQKDIFRRRRFIGCFQNN